VAKWKSPAPSRLLCLSPCSRVTLTRWRRRPTASSRVSLFWFLIYTYMKRYLFIYILFISLYSLFPCRMTIIIITPKTSIQLPPSSSRARRSHDFLFAHYRYILWYTRKNIYTYHCETCRVSGLCASVFNPSFIRRTCFPRFLRLMVQ